MKKSTAATIDQDLLTTPYVFLDFGSPGCAPCKKVPAMLDELIAALPETPITAFAIDVTEEQAIAQRFFVLGVPTLIFFRNGKEVARFNAVPKKEKLIPFLKK